MMELRYLETFRTVVEEGSIAQAAQKLNYTQSTITFQIGKLEKELSAQLFAQDGRQAVLTDMGKQLIPYVDDVLQSVHKLRFFQNGDAGECRGDIRVGIEESLLCCLLPPLLKDFRRHAPKARLLLQSMNDGDIRDALLSGTLELGVFYQNVGGFGSAFHLLPLGEYPASLVASPATAQAYADFQSADQEIPVMFIATEPKCTFRQMFEQYLREKSIRLSHTVELCSIHTIKALAANDMGIAFLPTFAVEEELASGALQELATDMGIPALSAVCAYHQNQRVSSPMQLFLDLCQAYFASSPTPEPMETTEGG